MKRPDLPPLRRVADTVLSVIFDELREVIRQILQDPLLFGDTVTVTFSAADTPVKVAHALDRTAEGYIVIRRDANITVRDADGEGLWVQSDGAGSATLRVI